MNKHALNGIVNWMEDNKSRQKKLLIFGLGYAATAVAKHVAGQFDEIVTTNRTLPKQQLPNCTHLVFNGEIISDELQVQIAEATHILVSIGPGPAGDPVYNAAQQLLKNANGLQWIGYLSTVGVYGNHDGAWVDEDTVCRPVSRRSIERLAAEENWLELAKEIKIALAIFRLSGIYGPGRNAMVNMDKGRSRRLVKKDQVFNRIHRDDIAVAVANAMAGCIAGIFNITDDEPAPPQDVVTYVHNLRGVKPPPEIDFETADITPMARSFYGENKRVSNARSKSVLNMEYSWPNYRKAFDAMMKDEGWR